MHSTITRRLDTVRRRTAMATAMAGELGTAARRAIQCKAAPVSPIKVPSAADGAPGTVVRPAIRSRVASASRIAAIELLKSSPTTAALGGAQIKEAGNFAKLAPRFCHKRSRCGSAFDGCLQLGWPLSGVRAEDSRHCAAPRRSESFIGNGPVYFSATY